MAVPVTDSLVSRPPWPERLRGWFTVALGLAFAAALEISYAVSSRQAPPERAGGEVWESTAPNAR